MPSKSSAAPSGAAPSLKLWSPGDAGPSNSELDLRAAFEVHFLPIKTDLAPATVGDMRSTLKAWELLTSNPPVKEITDETMTVFRDALAKSRTPQTRGETNSPYTVNKNLRNITDILRRLGPRVPGNKFGLEILTRIPATSNLAVDEPVKRIASDADLAALFESSHVPDWPALEYLPRPRRLYWEAVPILLPMYGPRTGDFLSLCWEDSILRGDPHVSGRTDPLRLYLEFRAKKTRRMMRPPLRLPLNSLALTVIARLHYPGAAGLIFPFPNSHDRRRGAWAQMCAAAKLSRPITWQNLRQTCSTRHNQIIPGIGERITDHAKSGVAETFYDDFEKQMRESVDQFKLPEPMSAERSGDRRAVRDLIQAITGSPHGLDRQLNLF